MVQWYRTAEGAKKRPISDQADNSFVVTPEEERAPYLAERRAEIIQKLDKDSENK